MGSENGRSDGQSGAASPLLDQGEKGDLSGRGYFDFTGIKRWEYLFSKQARAKNNKLPYFYSVVRLNDFIPLRGKLTLTLQEK